MKVKIILKKYISHFLMNKKDKKDKKKNASYNEYIIQYLMKIF